MAPRKPAVPPLGATPDAEKPPTVNRPVIGYDDNPAAPQVFADEAVGFWLHNGVVMLTLILTHIDHHVNPGPINCWERVICPHFAARRMSGLFVTCSDGGACGGKRSCGVFS